MPTHDESRICRRVLKKEKKSVADQFAVKYRSEKHCWTQKLNREDYGVTSTGVLLDVVKE